MTRTRLLLGLMTSALAIAGCTSSSPHPSSPHPHSPPVSGPGVPTTTGTSTPPPMRVPCPPAARAVLARADRGTDVRLIAHVGAGLSTCSYEARVPSETQGIHYVCTSAKLTINTSAQAFTDFNRWVDEQEQNSAIPGQAGLAPRQIAAPRLGIEVDWVPGRQTLETGRPGRWVSIFLQCRGATARTRTVALRLASTAAAH